MTPTQIVIVSCRVSTGEKKTVLSPCAELTVLGSHPQRPEFFDVFILHCYPLAFALLYPALLCTIIHSCYSWHHALQLCAHCALSLRCQACQALCAKTSGCGHFSYWSDGGCLLTSETAYAVKHGGVVSGGPSCGASDTYHEPAYKGPSVMKVSPRGGMDPPTHVQQYNGVAWPTMKITDNKDD